MMTPVRKMAFKLAAYSAFVLYLIGDLYLWHGYLANHFDAHFKPMPKGMGDDSDTVALVYGEPVSRQQLTRRMEEMAYLKDDYYKVSQTGMIGMSGDKKRALQVAAINDLVNASLLRLKTRLSDTSLKDTNSEAEKAVDRIESRFDGKHEAFMQALVDQKISASNLKDKMTSRLKQEAKLRAVVDPEVPVSDKNLKMYYDLVKEKIKIPRTRTGEHIFFATLGKNPDEVKAQAEVILAELKSGNPFHELAVQYSEDERTASNGGKLGVLSESRNLLPGVDLWNLEANVPLLVQSRLGWHIMRLSDIIPARIPAFEEVKETLASALYSLRRQRGAEIYADNIRKEARQSGRVEIDPRLIK